jgi:hypothetical protein
MLAAGPLHHLAIMTALTLRSIFRLALRQTEGLIGSITLNPAVILTRARFSAALQLWLAVQAGSRRAGGIS